MFMHPLFSPFHGEASGMGRQSLHLGCIPPSARSTCPAAQIARRVLGLVILSCQPALQLLPISSEGPPVPTNASAFTLSFSSSFSPADAGMRLWLCPPVEPLSPALFSLEPSGPPKA